MDRSHDVTRLLRRVSEGEGQASAELLPLVYAELRKLARARMAREGPGHTLQPTALVHEAYLRLVKGDDPRWDDRGHFFAAAAEAMRRILVERARRAAAHKHGGDVRRVSLDDQFVGEEPRPAELLALDVALERLETLDSDLSRVVKLRYFAGLSVPETAQVLGRSPRSVNRSWSEARAWLYKEMMGMGPGMDGTPED